MKKEYNDLIKNVTWKLMDPPYGIEPIGSKWLFKNKHRSYASLENHRERIIVKGFAQKEGVDYEDTFSPVEEVWVDGMVEDYNSIMKNDS